MVYVNHSEPYRARRWRAIALAALVAAVASFVVFFVGGLWGMWLLSIALYCAAIAAAVMSRPRPCGAS
ncbi:hypothetical protein LGT39_05920 [Demequina sp. TTPB684]|uniref:hypothetical protein n=1 Tax=unclassified Demequina TaxID=2620311 RepID=UPI001CF27904|nr:MULTISPECIES: hypothetical protein [unclassified Demequina]MCB2412385.1 hypothetical protein [Demequina sp. TTPB684]UPU89055.1 hypothetical protein LGT36_003775 [Demequina sp. TMPB413]